MSSMTNLQTCGQGAGGSIPSIKEHERDKEAAWSHPTMDLTALHVTPVSQLMRQLSEQYQL